MHNLNKEMFDLLDTEKTVILKGSFAELEDLHHRKIMLLERGLEFSDADTIRQQLTRNQRLLDAASRGLRNALEKIKILAQSGELSTYSADGKLVNHTKNTAKLEHKA